MCQLVRVAPSRLLPCVRVYAYMVSCIYVSLSSPPLNSTSEPLPLCTFHPSLFCLCDSFCFLSPPIIACSIRALSTRRKKQAKRGRVCVTRVLRYLLLSLSFSLLTLGSLSLSILLSHCFFFGLSFFPSLFLLRSVCHLIRSSALLAALRGVIKEVGEHIFCVDFLSVFSLSLSLSPAPLLFSV